MRKMKQTGKNREMNFSLEISPVLPAPLYARWVCEDLFTLSRYALRVHYTSLAAEWGKSISFSFSFPHSTRIKGQFTGRMIKIELIATLFCVCRFAFLLPTPFEPHSIVTFVHRPITLKTANL